MVWKILFVIYALIMLGLGFAGLGIENTVRVSPSEAIVNTCVEIVLVFAMIYTFALGWKKRLIPENVHKWLFYFSVISFAAVGILLYINVYAPMYADMILSAMKNGMVPRNWDFQMLLAMTRIEVLIFVLLALFITMLKSAQSRLVMHNLRTTYPQFTNNQSRSFLSSSSTGSSFSFLPSWPRRLNLSSSTGKSL